MARCVECKYIEWFKVSPLALFAYDPWCVNDAIKVEHPITGIKYWEHCKKCVEKNLDSHCKDFMPRRDKWWKIWIRKSYPHPSV